VRWGIVLGIFVCAWAFDAAFAVRHGFFDLRVYYGALNHWVDGNGEIYDYLLPGTKYGFTYPPFAALRCCRWPTSAGTWRSGSACCSPSSPRSRCCTGWSSRLPAATAGRRGSCWASRPGSPWRFEPLRETFLFGQVNAVLLFLVAADLLFLVRYNRSVAGVGIGLATAIKLTPGIFIVYLVITRRFRAAMVASGTTMAATVFAAAVAPDASRDSGPTRCGTPAGSATSRSCPTSRSTASSTGGTRRSRRAWPGWRSS
jgi:alpha-1,2-mannosyltransferase